MCYLQVVIVVGCRGGDRFFSHHELRLSVSPVLNPYTYRVTQKVYPCPNYR